MSFEGDLYAVLGPQVGGRAFPDVAPLNTPRPYATYQQVGGEAINFLEAAVVGKRHARMQINIWADTRLQANALARTVEDALVTSELIAYVIGALTAYHYEDLNLYGCRQDYSFFY